MTTVIQFSEHSEFSRYHFGTDEEGTLCGISLDSQDIFVSLETEEPEFDGAVHNSDCDECIDMLADLGLVRPTKIELMSRYVRELRHEIRTCADCSSGGCHRCDYNSSQIELITQRIGQAVINESL